MAKIRWFITGLFIIFVAAGAAFAGLSLLVGPEARPAIPVFGQGERLSVSPGAVLKKENCYLCGDVELIFQGVAPGNMLGKDLKGLQEDYPESDGWTVELKDPKLVVLRKTINDFCGRHSLYRHLGVKNGRLAVYQGPLGFDQKLLRVEENIIVRELPQALRQNLEKAANFNNLPPGERAALINDLEFVDQNVLNSTLENLDESAGRNS
ncbi:MAG: hypothetical protein ACOY31_04070 [Bacillota bacterium]